MSAVSGQPASRRRRDGRIEQRESILYQEHLIVETILFPWNRAAIRIVVSFGTNTSRGSLRSMET